MNTTITTASVKNSVNNNKIQDFGQKIGGARKDWFANMKEAAQKFAEVSAVDLIAAPLSKVVALPNLEKMTEAGALSADSARAVLTLWRNIETRPSGSTYRLQRWATKTAPKLARIGAILNGEQITEEERTAVDFQILTAANWPAESFNFGRVKTGRYFSGELYAAAGHSYIARSSNAADIVAAIRTQNEKDARKRAEGVRLAICYNRAGEYFVTPENKTEIVLFKGSRAECYDQTANHADELRARYAEIKSVPELRRDWNRPRVGEDWRKGQDITPETFAAVLPFRGVEFGNWVTQAERASLLNSAETEVVTSGDSHYEACENPPIPEKYVAGSPSSPSFRCWGVFEFGDVDCNSHEPRLSNAFDTEAKAREWMQKCADGTGALCADAVDVLACAGGFWMVWFSDRSGGYYCQYIAQRADARDLSGALLRCESLNLRQRLHDLKREHMARQITEKVAKLKAGEVYAVDYDGDGVTAENDSANAGRYVVTFWNYGETKERHTDRTAAEAAQAVADFVAVNIPAKVWASQRCLLHTFRAGQRVAIYDQPEITKRTVRKERN